MDQRYLTLEISDVNDVGDRIIRIEKIPVVQEWFIIGTSQVQVVIGKPRLSRSIHLFIMMTGLVQKKLLSIRKNLQNSVGSSGSGRKWWNSCYR